MKPWLNRVAVLALSGILIGIASCATIFTGTTDSITFETNPPGAMLMIDGIDRGRTPVTLPVNRAGLGDRHVTFRLDDYQTRTFVLQKQFNMVTVANIVCLVGFWICGAVDLLSGAAFKFDPTYYSFELAPARTEGGHGDDMPLVYRIDQLLDITGAVVVPTVPEGKVVGVIDPISQEVFIFQ